MSTITSKPSAFDHATINIKNKGSASNENTTQNNNQLQRGKLDLQICLQFARLVFLYYTITSLKPVF
jgi:hypothetical protein